MVEYIEKKKLVNRLKMWLMDLENDMDKGDYGELCENKGASDAVESCICEVEEQPLADVQPVRHMWWITKAEDYYKAWQDSGRSWDDMPYFVTGVKFACSNCFGQFDIDAKGVEKWKGCPLCLARYDYEPKYSPECGAKVKDGDK